MKLQSLQFYINSKTINLHHVKSVIIFAKIGTHQMMTSSSLHWTSDRVATPRLPHILHTPYSTNDGNRRRQAAQSMPRCRRDGKKPTDNLDRLNSSLGFSPRHLLSGFATICRSSAFPLRQPETRWRGPLRSRSCTP